MALNIAIDTNRYVDFHNGVEVAAKVVQSADRVVIPFIVLAELRGGFRVGSRSEANEKRLAEFLRGPRVEVVFADEGTTQFYAMLYADLRRGGTPIPTNDIWIAAIVLQHNMVLFSRDRHFDAVPRIARV